MRLAIEPLKNYPPLVVDADGVEAAQFALQFLKMARRNLDAKDIRRIRAQRAA